jgi:hypothetical protein
MKPAEPFLLRFMRKVLPEPNSGCWLWEGTYHNGTGRPLFSVRKGRSRTAARIAYELFCGPIPENKMVCHHCDNKACVNPSHLYAGTAFDNMRDLVQRGLHWKQRDPAGMREHGRKLGSRNTWAKGEAHGSARLRASDIEAIRASDEPTRVMVARYGISPSHVRRVRRGKAWASTLQISEKAVGL